MTQQILRVKLMEVETHGARAKVLVREIAQEPSYLMRQLDRHSGKFRGQPQPFCSDPDDVNKFCQIP